MESRMGGRERELTALLIAPDRELARQFASAAGEARTFQIISELKSYPPEHTLEIRLRQMRPEVVLVDLLSDLDAAAEVIRLAVGFGQGVQVAGLHRDNNSEAILRSLRMGASEFLYAPFEAAIQRDAVARLRRLREPDSTPPPQPGNITVFSSAKPGSGASTITTQTAFALRKLTGKKVLLADFDLMGGAIGFHLKVSHTQSLLDALKNADQLSSTLWSSLVSACGGVDVLSAPEAPYAGPIDSTRLHVVLEFARLTYDWVLIDLPVIFQRLSLMTISECDRAFLVSTSELPSLHLARKAVGLLDQLGFPKERFQALVNRINRRDEIAGADLDKLFNCPVHSRLPNDYFALHRAVTLGQPLEGHSELGKAVEGLAGRLAGRPAGARAKTIAAEPATSLARA
jgi:Flp pilus assembly CpaE family ATPase